MADAFLLFPETLRYDKDLGFAYARRIEGNPKPNFIQGKALEGMLWKHQRQFTEVIETDESLENQWWDGYLPLIGNGVRMDPKSRNTGTSSFTISAREKMKQLSCTGLFIWPLYRVDGNLFVRDFVLARCKGTELIGPPGPEPSKHVEYGKEPSWYWPTKYLATRETLALTQMNELNLLSG
jgi:hypothetical protein